MIATITVTASHRGTGRAVLAYAGALTGFEVERTHHRGVETVTTRVLYARVAAGESCADVAADLTARDRVDAAITAHVAAEVARALAAAPGVEDAIEGVADLYAAAARGILDADEIRLRDESIPILRAAIAADRERAVREAGHVDAQLLRDALRYVNAWGCVPGSSTEWLAKNNDRVADGLRGVLAGSKARPTPDEARRLVDDFSDATLMANLYSTSGPERITARAALLRALGVEA